MSEGSAAYAGPDRRADASRAPVSRRRIALGAVLGGTCSAGVQLVAAAPGAAPSTVATAVALAWSAPLVVASVTLLCAWRVGGRAAPAHWGAAAVLAGGAGPATAWLACALLHHGGGAAAAAALTAGAAAGAVHARAALRGAAVRTDVRPLLAVAGGTCLVLAAAAGGAATAADLPAAASPLVAGGLLGEGGPAAVPLAALVALLGAVGGAALAGGLEALRTALLRQQLRGLRAVAELQRRVREAADDRLRRHDARSALSAVRAASSVLTGERPAVTGPAALALADGVRAELSRVERLLAGPERTPAPATRPGVVDLREAARPVVDAWRARGVQVTGPGPGADTGLDGPAPALAVGDVDGVRRLLGNLLANAERHAPGAAVHLELLAPVDGRVVLRVRDDGPGVPAADRETVFAPGARLRHDVDGEGLGLASARALAEADGGSLHLVDVPAGACFELRLPAAAAAREAVAR